MEITNPVDQFLHDVEVSLFNKLIEGAQEVTGNGNETQDFKQQFSFQNNP
jgi:hypothetical protein